MSSDKLIIMIATRNRRKITSLCLANLKKYKQEAHLYVHDDASAEYDTEWLRQFADTVVRSDVRCGVTEIAKRNLNVFLSSSYKFFYCTDNDAIHDPTFIDRLFSIYEKTGMCVSLYNRNTNPRRVIGKFDEQITIKRGVSGISMFLDKNVARQPTLALNKRIKPPSDWDIVASKRIKHVAYPTISYVDHYGAGGLHHPGYNRRAQDPSKYLTKIRSKIIYRLQKETRWKY